MTEKEKCFNKNTYFEEKGAVHAIKFQPDKKHYQCDICKFWHLTTGDISLTRGVVARDAIHQDNSIEIKSRQHFLCREGEEIYYVVFERKGQTRQRRKLERVERVDDSTALPKKVKKLLETI